MRKLEIVGILLACLFVISVGILHSQTDEGIQSNIEVTLNIREWMINPVEYTGFVEIAYTGDQTTSIVIEDIKISKSENILWKTDISRELKGPGEDYDRYKNALDAFNSAKSETVRRESYETLMELYPKIAESKCKIKVPIQPNKIFSETGFQPGVKETVTFTVTFSYQGELYRIEKSQTLEVREPFPTPPPLRGCEDENKSGGD